MKAATLWLSCAVWLVTTPTALAQHIHSAPVAATPPLNLSLDKDSSPSSIVFPAPTAEERAAAFPELHNLHTRGMRSHMDDDPFIATLLFNRLEWQYADDVQQSSWEVQGWAGGLDRRIWLRSEGEYQDQQTVDGDIELLWGRPTGPWWDALIGIRHDFGEQDSHDWLAIGLQGLAPYKFKVATTLYIGEDKRISARAEIEYDVLLTNRLILQPRIESNYYSRSDSERSINKGINDVEVGLRLRYELNRQFAPYIGYVWSQKFGEATVLTQPDGISHKTQYWTAGLHFWF